MVLFEFSSPKDLKKQYEVFGNFYNVLHAGNIKGYRNDLHIIDKDYFEGHGLTTQIELLVIMMNPGGSAPVSKTHLFDNYTKEMITMRDHCSNLIPTMPDNTQYQVMRMMKGLQIKHTRVINISDIRETQSNSLAVDLKSGISDLHSIFSDSRQDELRDVYSSLADEAFVFLAWGRDIINCRPFKLLAERCILTLPQDKIVLGIPGDKRLKFKHPLSRGSGGSAIVWLQEAESCFNEYFTSQIESPHKSEANLN